MVTASAVAHKGTVTEPITDRSSLNLYQMKKARLRGGIEHVAQRLQESDIWKAYLTRLPPGTAVRLAIIATQANAEHIASRSAANPPVHCIREAIEIAEGRARGPRPSGAGPGCEDCQWSGVQINDEDRQVVPCCNCATTVLVKADAPRPGWLVQRVVDGRALCFGGASLKGDVVWRPTTAGAILFPSRQAAQVTANGYAGATPVLHGADVLMATDEDDTGHHDFHAGKIGGAL